MLPTNNHDSNDKTKCHFISNDRRQILHRNSKKMNSKKRQEDYYIITAHVGTESKS